MVGIWIVSHFMAIHVELEQLISKEINMKRVILLAVIMVMFSCDHPAYHDFYISNKCDQDIVIEVVDNKQSKSSVTIKPSTEEIIYHGETINEVFEDEITFFINKIDVYKNGVKASVDLLDYRLWQFEEHSKYYGVSTISIQSDDF